MGERLGPAGRKIQLIQERGIKYNPKRTYRPINRRNLFSSVEQELQRFSSNTLETVQETAEQVSRIATASTYAATRRDVLVSAGLSVVLGTIGEEMWSRRIKQRPAVIQSIQKSRVGLEQAAQDYRSTRSRMERQEIQEAAQQQAQQYVQASDNLDEMDAESGSLSGGINFLGLMTPAISIGMAFAVVIEFKDNFKNKLISLSYSKPKV